jgi:NAD(P)-dependent dehydrogenase (short-subunit alcohol dehydrogenase family)
MLQRSEDGGRIVNVSSMLHLHADSVNPEVVKSSSFFKSYARSKLANVCLFNN